MAPGSATPKPGWTRRPGLRDEQKIAVELPGTRVPAGRTLFDGEALQVRYGGRVLFAGDGVKLAIRGPERIALTGGNGAGKSTLLRIINGEVEPEDGGIKRAEGRARWNAGWGCTRAGLPSQGPSYDSKRRVWLICSMVRRDPCSWKDSRASR